MSSEQRRAEKKREFEAECEAYARERARYAGLTFWERIEEADIAQDLKGILHELAERVGLEE